MLGRIRIPDIVIEIQDICKDRELASNIKTFYAAKQKYLMTPCCDTLLDMQFAFRNLDSWAKMLCHQGWYSESYFMRFREALKEVDAKFEEELPEETVSKGD